MLFYKINNFPENWKKEKKTKKTKKTKKKNTKKRWLFAQRLLGKRDKNIQVFL